MSLRRGDLVTVAAKGAYTGKPRPALVIQADETLPLRDSITICLLTADLIDASLFRVRIEPRAARPVADLSNNLRATHQVPLKRWQAPLTPGAGPTADERGREGVRNMLEQLSETAEDDLGLLEKDERGGLRAPFDEIVIRAGLRKAA